jgi:hypothetical protein
MPRARITVPNIPPLGRLSSPFGGFLGFLLLGSMGYSPLNKSLCQSYHIFSLPAMNDTIIWGKFSVNFFRGGIPAKKQLRSAGKSAILHNSILKKYAQNRSGSI